MTIRIAHVIPAITVGGLWRHLEAISQLERSQFRSLVVSIFDRDVPELVNDLGLPVVQIKIEPESYLEVESIQGEIRHVLDDFAPSVVHSYHLYSDIYTLPLLRQVGCRGVRAIHGITQVEFSDPFNRRGVKTDWLVEDLARMRMLSPLCSLTLAVSGDLKKRLISHGLDDKPIRVVYPGVDLDIFRWRAKGAGGRGNAIIGFLGRLEPVKNPFLFIDIAAQCIERGFEGEFWIIGSGRLGNQVRDEIERRGMSRQVVMKAETHHIEHLLNELDVLVVTSLSEGLPLSIIEAMAVGVPVVASSVGGVPEVIKSGRNGFLCSIDRPEEFVDCILKLIYNPDMRSNLAFRARAVVERKFSLLKHLASMARVYDEVSNG